MEGCQSFGNNLNKNRFSEKIEDFPIHSYLNMKDVLMERKAKI